MKKIVQKETPVLRQTAQIVPLKEIGTEKIKKVVSDMKAALAGEEDGVAIAAPQIGVSLRIFVVSRKVELLTKAHEGLTEEEKKKITDSVYINPEIKKVSKTKVWLDEGCLSVRYLYGKVERAEKATVTAVNEKGKIFTKGASGLLAQIFQHEIDHLNGVLFIDKARDLAEILPEKHGKK